MVKLFHPVPIYMPFPTFLSFWQSMASLELARERVRERERIKKRREKERKRGGIEKDLWLNNYSCFWILSSQLNIRLAVMALCPPTPTSTPTPHTFSLGERNGERCQEITAFANRSNRVRWICVSGGRLLANAGSTGSDQTRSNRLDRAEARRPPQGMLGKKKKRELSKW